MKAIVTAVGQDRVGITAAICAKLAAYNISIQDISQTIMEGTFTMIMSVDVGAATAPFEEIVAGMEQLAREMKLSIRIQREEIFASMHTI